ncbi:restriction endonuclease subunit S [Patescibacteria group bacterium]|nr:restriction endonuclease subunit S [Patescibacteria group bacterium]MBU4142292.1 restriction endonuclease subunit S [Patescibacteria group bacterium]MBU4339090.1 restriction endonuclease subunit S [Patescibacteria group bacterium]MCG2694778.1 restriction endonuclease subunit S [Candidatus Parcubacteria bacterium]
MSQISIIKKSDIQEARRFDAEFFKPEYLDIEEKLENIKYDFLYNLADNKYKKFNKSDDYFHYIEIANINLITGEYSKEKIKTNEIPSRAQKICNKNDVLISMVRPNRNAVSIIQEDLKNLVASTGFCKLTNIKINPYYLFILFKTKDYVKLLIRHTTATMYPAVTEDDILNLKIPILPQSFQLQIEKIVKSAYEKQTQSKQLYKEAETILLEELGLINYKPEHILSFETTKKKADGANRFDAEYFQPKYEEIIKRVESYHNGWDYVKNLVSWKKGIEVGSDAYRETGKDFIRVADFSINKIENSSKKISDELFEKNKNEYQPQKGEMIFTKDGTIGTSYVLKEDVNGVLSGAFLRLNLEEKYRDLEKECLSLIFNSIVCKMQVEKLSGGAIIAHLKPSDFEKFKIPLIEPKIQKQIAERIQKSYILRKQSEELLEEAKRKVEEEIEKEAGEKFEIKINNFYYE